MSFSEQILPLPPPPVKVGANIKLLSAREFSEVRKAIGTKSLRFLYSRFQNYSPNELMRLEMHKYAYYGSLMKCQKVKFRIWHSVETNKAPQKLCF